MEKKKMYLCVLDLKEKAAFPKPSDSEEKKVKPLRNLKLIKKKIIKQNFHCNSRPTIPQAKDIQFGVQNGEKQFAIFLRRPGKV